MASVGQVFYDVLPNLDGFAAKVAAGLGQAKPIKIPVEADGAKAEASLKKVTTQTGQLSTSSARLAAAQGKVRVEAARLNETRQKATAGSAKLITAEERYAKAIRGVQTAQEQDAKAAVRVTQQRDKAVAQQVAQSEKLAASEAKAAAQQKAMRQATTQSLGKGLLIGGAATAVALSGIAKVTADFDQAVSNVASTGKEARASLSQLRAEAIKYGAATAFSAQEAAAGQEELLKAGVSVKDVLGGGLKGALDLAASGNLGVAASAEAAATAVNQFSLKGSDFTHVADLMAQVAGTAQGEVSDVAAAFKNGGLTAAKFGLSIDETAQTLAVFAQNGIVGAEAGTKLSSSLINLYAPLGQSKKALDGLKISTKDATGNLLPIGNVLDQLKTRLAGLDESAKKNALARIFGKENITAGLALVEQGSAGLAQASKDFAGFGSAADVARVKMDNLKGDVEKLGGAFQSAFIETGSSSAGGLRTITQGVTGLIDTYSKLPEAGKSAAFIGTGLAAAAAIGAGGVIKLVGVANDAKTALNGLGISAKTAGLAAGAIGLGITAAAAVIGNFAVKQAEAKARTDDLTQSLLQSKGAIDQNIAATRAKSLEDSGSLAAAQKLGISIADITQASLGNAAAQERVRVALDASAQSTAQLSDLSAGMDPTLTDTALAADKVRDAIAGGNKEIAAAIDAYKRQETAAAAATGSVGAVASSVEDTNIALQRGARNFPSGADGINKIGSAAGDAAGQLKTLADKAYAAAAAALGLSGGAIAVEAAMDAASAAAKENGKNLDISTEKGRNNQIALDDLATKQRANVSLMEQQKRGPDAIAAANERAKASYIKSAVAMGQHEKAARKDADALFALPAKVATQIVVSGSKVSRKEAKDLNKELKGIPKETRARLVSIANTKGAKVMREELAKVKNKSVIAKATGKGVNTVKEIDSAIKKLKSKQVQANAKSAGKGAVDDLHSAIGRLKSKRVTVTAAASGQGSLSSLQSAIGRIRGKTVYVDVKRRAAGKGVGAVADGGYITGFAGGGVVRGTGGPREDNIAGIDRATGQQTSWVSAKEFVTNAVTTANNLGALSVMNANPGKRYDIVERAGGGPVGVAGTAAPTRSNGRPLILNIDMGDLGVRRLVTQIVEDRDEYHASIGRMH